MSVAIRSVLLQNGYADLYLLRFIKPFDEEYFISIAKKYDSFVIVEDGVKEGGIGQDIQTMLLKNNLTDITLLGFKDKYLSHGSRSEVLELTELTSNHIQKAILKC